MKSIDLYRLARTNLVDELREAICEGATLDDRDEFTTTALQYAIAASNLDIVSLLLKHGADVMVQDGNGKTALHYAIEYKLPHVAEELIKSNPKVVAVADRFGNEPLWTAVFNANKRYDLVELLLRYGADPKHLNNANLTPSDIPRRKRDAVLLQILESRQVQQS